MTPFQKYTVATVFMIFSVFAAFYCFSNRMFIPLFIFVVLGLAAGIVRAYYKNQRMKATDPDRVAVETLSELGKRK